MQEEHWRRLERLYLNAPYRQTKLRNSVAATGGVMRNPCI